MRFYKIFGFVRHLVWALIVLFSIVWISQLKTMFYDQTVFTLQFTNIAAALFFALANVCFSWSRSLKEPRNELSIRRLNRIAFTCIFTSIFFVFTSFSNYIIQSPLHRQGNVYFSAIVFWLTMAKFITLFIALILMCWIIYQLFNEGWHLFKYEYAMISDDGDNDSRDQKMERRLARLDKAPLVLECIRKNEFSEEKIDEKILKFTKGNVSIKFQDQPFTPFLDVNIECLNGTERVSYELSTSNINELNLAIRKIRKEHVGELEQLQELLHTEKLLHG